MIFFKPKDKFQKNKWTLLHEKDYHPSVEESIKRILDQKNRNIWIFDEWSKILDIDLSVKDKTILEIGFGGGWYLSQMLFRGACKVIGFEITGNVINKAIRVFQSLGLKNYEFYEVDDKFLNVLSKNIDIIFEVTVFQHISEDITRNYLLSSTNVLNDNGLILCQFLMNDNNPKKNPYAKNKEGIVYYSHNEILKITNDCNLKIEKYGDFDWKDENNSYWRLYMMTKL